MGTWLFAGQILAEMGVEHGIFYFLCHTFAYFSRLYEVEAVDGFW